MDYLSAGIVEGLSVSVFQWSTYGSDLKRPLNAEIRQMAQEGKLRVVAAGEKVSTTSVIVGSPMILQHVIDLCPEVEFSNFVIVVDEVINMRGDHNPLHVARQNLGELFGTEGIWVPTSKRVYRQMLTDPRYPPPHPEIWTAKRSGS